MAVSYCCFLSRIYIKPQLLFCKAEKVWVVSYLVSTSNHNLNIEFIRFSHVVSYLVSTSNHNCCRYIKFIFNVVSYLVSTSNHNWLYWSILLQRLFLISYLHQTTTILENGQMYISCFLSRIYIKPQPFCLSPPKPKRCFLSRIYIKPQPIGVEGRTAFCCFLSRIYIKPQRT